MHPFQDLIHCLVSPGNVLSMPWTLNADWVDCVLNPKCESNLRDYAGAKHELAIKCVCEEIINNGGEDESSKLT